MKSALRIIFAAVLGIFISSCSTTRVLQDGEYRLTKNRIRIENDREFNPNQLNKYLKQNESLGWSPFLYVYNWSNGKGKGWDKFVQKIGKAPVVYDPDMVESSIENLENHLEYLGYYGSEVDSRISVKKKRVTVDYSISLGKRFPIRDITYALPERGEFAASFLADTSLLTVKRGDFLSEMALEEETAAAGARMKNQGFFDFSKNNFFFEADTLTYPDYALLEMRVNEYTRNESPNDAEPIRRYNIGDVTFSYPKSLKIRENILRNLNTIIPGDL